MAGPPPTLLPRDPAQDDLDAGMAPADVVRRPPASPVAWLAVGSLAAAEEADPLTVYAYARVGYHRSLDLLRRNGWKGHGPVPWEHEPNRGFLRALGLLAWAASRIGETAEAERCAGFLRDPSPAAYDELPASGLGRTRGRAARWSGGKMVRRPDGQAARWSGGQMVRRPDVRSGARTRRTPGRAVPSSLGALDRRARSRPPATCRSRRRGCAASPRG